MCSKLNLFFEMYIILTWFGDTEFWLRFQVKRLFCLGADKRVFRALNGYKVRTKVVGNDMVSQLKSKREFLKITITPHAYSKSHIGPYRF